MKFQFPPMPIHPAFDLARYQKGVERQVSKEFGVSASFTWGTDVCGYTTAEIIVAEEQAEELSNLLWNVFSCMQLVNS